MISLINSLPRFEIKSAEQFRIKSNFSLYPDISLFWKSETGGLVSSLDNNITLWGSFDFTELSGFLYMLSPASVFCDEKTAQKLTVPYKKHTVFVMYREDDGKPAQKSDEATALLSDTLKSDEIYGILKSGGLTLPPTDVFSVDFCHRLNRNALCFFARRDICAAIALTNGDTALINGIASLKKGMGSAALNAVIKKSGKKRIFAVCEESVIPFYEKNGFKMKYKAVSFTK